MSTNPTGRTSVPTRPKYSGIRLYIESCASGFDVSHVFCFNCCYQCHFRPRVRVRQRIDGYCTSLSTLVEHRSPSQRLGVTDTLDFLHGSYHWSLYGPNSYLEFKLPVIQLGYRPYCTECNNDAFKPIQPFLSYFQFCPPFSPSSDLRQNLWVILYSIDSLSF